MCSTILLFLLQVDQANTTEELRSLLSEDTFDFRFTCGYNKPTQQIELKDKHDVLRSIWLHHVLYHPHAELEQLRGGFCQTLQVNTLICLYEKEFRALLAHSTIFDVTVSYLQDSFAIKYSDNGSNSRTKEEAIIFHWLEYISNCNGNLPPPSLSLSLPLPLSLSLSLSSSLSLSLSPSLLSLAILWLVALGWALFRVLLIAIV